MKYGGFGSGPVRGERLRPAFGPMDMDSMQGRRGPSPMRPPGLVAPPVQQGQAPGATGSATPVQGYAPQMQQPPAPPPVPQTGLPVQAGPGGSIAQPPNGMQQQMQPPNVNQQMQPPNGMQQQMQHIMRDPFLSHIMRQRPNPGYGGQQFQQPFRPFGGLGR